MQQAFWRLASQAGISSLLVFTSASRALAQEATGSDANAAPAVAAAPVAAAPVAAAPGVGVPASAAAPAVPVTSPVPGSAPMQNPGPTAAQPLQLTSPSPQHAVPATGWQVPSNWASLPKRLPYREGQEAPYGYTLRERSLRGAWIAGAAMIGLPYLIGVVRSSETNFKNHTSWLVIPVLGPWLTISTRDSECRGVSNCNFSETEGSTRLALVASGLLQVGGAVLAGYGLSTVEKYWHRTDLASIYLTPMVAGTDGYGLMVNGAL